MRMAIVMARSSTGSVKIVASDTVSLRVLFSFRVKADDISRTEMFREENRMKVLK